MHSKGVFASGVMSVRSVFDICIAQRYSLLKCFTTRGLFDSALSTCCRLSVERGLRQHFLMGFVVFQCNFTAHIWALCVRWRDASNGQLI